MLELWGPLGVPQLVALQVLRPWLPIGIGQLPKCVSCGIYPCLVHILDNPIQVHSAANGNQWHVLCDVDGPLACWTYMLGMASLDDCYDCVVVVVHRLEFLLLEVCSGP